jgi:hypothetical protein
MIGLLISRDMLMCAAAAARGTKQSFEIQSSFSNSRCCFESFLFRDLWTRAIVCTTQAARQCYSDFDSCCCCCCCCLRQNRSSMQGKQVTDVFPFITLVYAGSRLLVDTTAFDIGFI